MEWCLVKHRDNFTFTLNTSIYVCRGEYVWTCNYNTCMKLRQYGRCHHSAHSTFAGNQVVVVQHVANHFTDLTNFMEQNISELIVAQLVMIFPS